MASTSAIENGAALRGDDAVTATSSTPILIEPRRSRKIIIEVAPSAPQGVTARDLEVAHETRVPVAVVYGIHEAIRLHTRQHGGRAPHTLWRHLAESFDIDDIEAVLRAQFAAARAEGTPEQRYLSDMLGRSLTRWAALQRAEEASS